MDSELELDPGSLARLPKHILWTFGAIDALPYAFDNGPLDEGYFEQLLHARESGDRMLKSRAANDCVICWNTVFLHCADTWTTCHSLSCDMLVHLTCLAKWFLHQSGTPGEYIPIQGWCPCCRLKMMWGDVVLGVRLRKRALFKAAEAGGRAKTVKVLDSDSTACSSDDELEIDNLASGISLSTIASPQKALTDKMNLLGL